MCWSTLADSDVGLGPSCLVRYIYYVRFVCWFDCTSQLKLRASGRTTTTTPYLLPPLCPPINTHTPTYLRVHSFTCFNVNIVSIYTIFLNAVLPHLFRQAIDLSRRSCDLVAVHWCCEPRTHVGETRLNIRTDFSFFSGGLYYSFRWCFSWGGNWSVGGSNAGA